MRRWRDAMREALYGPEGFYTAASSGGPAAHFRTSAHVSTVFAGSLSRLVARVDEALGRPDPFELVDVGAGRGELLLALLAELPRPLAARVRATAVEVGPPPGGLPPGIAWTDRLPPKTTGLLLATEWLDNVPVDVVCRDGSGVLRYVLVDASGTERVGPRVEPGDAAWLARWWPLDAAPEAARAEVGVERDAAWAAAVVTVVRGLAVVVDYGHLRGGRPVFGTLTGYRSGRRVPPVPDGSCDLTAHVALDAVAHAGGTAADVPPRLLSQRTALHALGVDGRRPPLSLAHDDPGAYLRALARAGVSAELTDPEGLGAHTWLLQPVGLDPHTLGMTSSHTRH
jgi:SAM-dependent MidA family methyltransferase